MNFYMYRKLRTALKRGVVDVGLVDRNVDYMVNKNWLKLDMLDSSRFTDYDPIPFPKGTAKITDEGNNSITKQGINGYSLQLQASLLALH